jgi:hypothetical protein
MSDIFELYKEGVDRLLEEIGEDHVDYDKVLDQRYRLMENIEKTERHGDNPHLKSERNEILHNLDNIARSNLKKPFHKFYEPKFPPNMPPDNKPRDIESTRVDSSEERNSISFKYRNVIVAIEHAVDTQSPINFTVEVIDIFVKDINAIIEWLRSHQSDGERFLTGKEAILHFLREARTKYILASEEYRRRGPTAKFLNNIEAGRELLERAIRAW